MGGKKQALPEIVAAETYCSIFGLPISSLLNVVVVLFIKAAHIFVYMLTLL